MSAWSPRSPGRTQHARILGWLFAALFGQLFVLTAGLVAGLEPAWSAFGVLAVGAALLILEAALPRLGRPEHLREATTVEWSGYAAGAARAGAGVQLAAAARGPARRLGCGPRARGDPAGAAVRASGGSCSGWRSASRSPAGGC